jgi:hypothetical protein
MSFLVSSPRPWYLAFYRKWNKCLYRELLKAYEEGRADRDPSELWYKGEIGFYNFYSKFYRFFV